MSVRFFNDKGRFVQVPTREAAVEIQQSEVAEVITQSQSCVVRCSKSLLIFTLKLVILILILAIYFCLTRVLSEILRYWIQYFCISNSDRHMLFISPFLATGPHFHSHWPPACYSVTVTLARSQRVPLLPSPRRHQRRHFLPLALPLAGQGGFSLSDHNPQAWNRTSSLFLSYYSYYIYKVPYH